MGEKQMNKQEALDKIKELEAFIKDIDKEQPEFYKGQIVEVKDDDWPYWSIKYFHEYYHDENESPYCVTRNIAGEGGIEAYEQCRPVPFDPRSIAPPDAVAYAVDEDGIGHWFEKRPKIKDDYWSGKGSTTENGYVYRVHDPIRAKNWKNSLVYCGNG
jgi:hypothetical protein